MPGKSRKVARVGSTVSYGPVTHLARNVRTASRSTSCSNDQSSAFSERQGIYDSPSSAPFKPPVGGMTNCRL